MQEQNNQNNAESNTKKPRRSILGSIMGCSLIALALGCGIWGYSQLPDSIGRDLSSPLPWSHGELVISSLDAGWHSTEGNSRMEKRTRLYPKATIKLKSAPGKGRLDVVFLDSLGTQIGDTQYLRYDNGQFAPKNDLTAKAEGDTASCWIETGFLSDDMFTLHRMNLNEALWRVVIYHRDTTNNTIVRLGQISIPAEVKN